MSCFERLEDRAGILKQASFTIEAALLMPLIFLVIFTSISLDFFSMSRVTCVSAACEQAVTGKIYEDLFLPGSAPASRSGQETQDVRNVRFSSKTAAIYGRFVWPIEAEAAYRKVHPVKGIRVSRAAARLIGGGKT